MWFRGHGVHIKYWKGTRWTWRRLSWKSEKKKTNIAHIFGQFHLRAIIWDTGFTIHSLSFFICPLAPPEERGEFRCCLLSAASVSRYHQASSLTNFPPVSEIWPIKPSATINPEPWLICESNYLPVCNGCVQCYDGKSAVVSICP